MCYYSLMLSTCPDESLRNASQAQSFAERAAVQDAEHPSVLYAKSCASALKGDFEGAIAMATRALKSDSFASDDSFGGGVFAKEQLEMWKQDQLLFYSPISGN